MEQSSDDVFCEVCGNVMEQYDESTSNPDEALDVEGELWCFWKPSDCRNHNFFACLDCKLFKVTDKNCNEYQFLGHQGFCEDGSQWSRNHKTHKKTELDTKSRVTDRDTPRWNISDLGKMHCRAEDWLLTGPQGGYKVFWYDCIKRKNLAFTDQ